MSTSKFTPILPFDSTQGENFQIYARTHYVRDIVLCGDDCVKMESGNLIKYFRCEEVKPVPVGGH